MRKPRALGPLEGKRPFILKRISEGRYETRAGKRGWIIIERYVHIHHRTRPRREVKTNKWRIKFEEQKYDGYLSKEECVKAIAETLCPNAHQLETEFRIAERHRIEANQREQAKARVRAYQKAKKEEKHARHAAIPPPEITPEEEAAARRTWVERPPVSWPSPEMEAAFHAEQAAATQPKRRRIGEPVEGNLFTTQPRRRD